MSARILVVEDEEALTTLLRYNLDAEGYEVETVARGDDADTRLKERVPDLIVLDWMLPGLSGIELCRRLRARPETKQLPIIMLTARGEESERVRGLATGADDYIVKPFSVPELLARGPRLKCGERSPERLATVLRSMAISNSIATSGGSPVLRAGLDRSRPAPNTGSWSSSLEHPGRVFSREQPCSGQRWLGAARSISTSALWSGAYRPVAQIAQSRRRTGPDPHRARRRLRAGRPLLQGE